MKPSKTIPMFFAALLATGASAQTPMDPASMKGMDMSKPGAMKMDMKPDAMKMDMKPDAMKMDQKSESGAMTDGEVRKLDKQQGLVTLKHGDIKNLGMPGMTMVFHTADKAMLDPVKPGDKVRFAAEMVNHQLMVTKIEVMR